MVFQPCKHVCCSLIGTCLTFLRNRQQWPYKSNANTLACIDHNECLQLIRYHACKSTVTLPSSPPSPPKKPKFCLKEIVILWMPNYCSRENKPLFKGGQKRTVFFYTNHLHEKLSFPQTIITLKYLIQFYNDWDT